MHLQGRRAWGIPFVFVVKFPAISFIDIVQFAFDVFEEFILDGGHFLLTCEHGLRVRNEQVEAEELPFHQAFGLFYIDKRIATEHPSAIGLLLKKFTFDALYHISLQKNFLRILAIIPIIDYNISFSDVFKAPNSSQEKRMAKPRRRRKIGSKKRKARWKVRNKVT